MRITHLRVAGTSIVVMSVLAGTPATAATTDAAAAHSPRPTVTSVVHNGFASGATTGGARVTVTGSHLSKVRSVEFGTHSGAHVKVLSSHKLQVTAPAHAIGEIHVKVRTTAGTSKVSPRNAFDFQAHHALDGGDDHTCQALGTTHTASCWGANGNGQLGNGTTTGSDEPVAVSGVEDVVSVATGGDHSCALRASGTVLCWGANADGQLGNGTTTSSSTATKVSGLGGRALDIAAGGGHTCAVVVGNSVRCWGDNIDGQLGDSTTTDRSRPVSVHHLTSVVAVTAGAVATCATRADGSEYCWGGNGHGQLGDGTTTSSSRPVKVIGIHAAVGGAAGNAAACILTGGGTVRCWGQGTEGELGNGASANSDRPVTVTGISHATSVAVGGFHACAVTGSRLRCWGFNADGQLGNGTDSDAATPVPVALTGVTAVGAGLFHSLALLANGSTEAWGTNSSGQLGNGTTTDSNVPVLVA